MNENFGKSPENPQLSTNENNDRNFSNSPDLVDKKKNNIEDGMKKSKAYSVLNALDSQGIKISKENEKSYISILEKKDISFLNELSNKPKNEILQFLIKAQIYKLEKSDDPDYDKLDELQKQLIAVEKAETTHNEDLIATKDAEITKEKTETVHNDKLIADEKLKTKKEVIETQERLTQVEARLSSIEGSLDSLKHSDNANVNEIFSLIGESKEFNKGKETSPEDIGKMEEKFAEIVKLLKNPGTLKSVSKDLKEQDKQNGTNNFDNFRSTLIGIDPSFEPYFSDLEQIEINPSSFSLDEISNGIEKDSGGMVDIDLKASDATSKLSLIGGKYSFDEKIDKQELDEVMGDSQEELENLKDNFGVIQEFESSFLKVRDGLGSIWGKPTFKEGLKELIKNFSNDVFNDFDDVYKNMNIDPSMQIKESDITSLGELDDPWDLGPKMKIVYKKIEHHQTEIAKNENSIVQKYETEFKDILKRKTEDKEKQLETLKFLRASGFDELPKWISNKVIKEVQGNVLTIPGLELARENIDLKNGNFGESGVFSGKEDGLNIESKTNLVKLVNKIISGDVNEPLGVEAIANGTTVADPRFVRSELMGVTRKGRTSWHYSKIIENLKKENR